MSSQAQDPRLSGAGGSEAEVLPDGWKECTEDGVRYYEHDKAGIRVRTLEEVQALERSKKLPTQEIDSQEIESDERLSARPGWKFIEESESEGEYYIHLQSGAMVFSVESAKLLEEIYQQDELDFRLWGWKRDQYRIILLTVLALILIVALAGAFVPGVLPAFAAMAALIAAGPVLPWVLLVVAGALLGLEIGLLAAAGTLSSSYKDLAAESNPDARQVLFSRLAILLGLLLGAVAMPFLAVTAFPGLLSLLAVTATVAVIGPALPWVLLGLMGAAAGLAVVGVIVAVLNLGISNFGREFFGSLRYNATEKMQESRRLADKTPGQALKANAGKGVGEHRASLEMRAKEREFERVKAGLIDYTLGSEAKFFVALRSPVIERLQILGAKDKDSNEQKIKALEGLKTVCDAAEKAREPAGPQVSIALQLEKAMQACKKACIDRGVLGPISEKIGQYKAAVMLNVMSDLEPIRLVGLIKAFSESESEVEAKEPNYDAMLADIHVDKLKEISKALGSKLSPSAAESGIPSGGSASSSAPAAWKLESEQEGAVKGLQQAIQERIADFLDDPEVYVI